MVKVIALEEHFRNEAVDAEMGNNYFRSINTAGEAMMRSLSDLKEVGERRIADMDRHGIDVQVLSHTVPSPEVLEPSRAVPLTQRVNDDLAETISRYPTRFAGFASLPIADPGAAARELERAVKQLKLKGAMIQGVSQGRFLDDPSFAPIFETAEALDVPLYLHPAPPPEPVMEAYFSGLEPGLARMLSIAGWGWHAETGLHTLRLIATGVFDRFPKLQMVIGHMGEMIPFFLARINAALTPAAKGLKRSVADYFRTNIHITSSGLFTAGPLYLTIEVIGIDRLMFSIDYPYSSNEKGRAYLNELRLPPGDFEKFTHVNAERLLKLA